MLIDIKLVKPSENLFVQDFSVVSLLEPSDGVLLGSLVRVTDDSFASLSSGDSVTGSTNHDVEVHTENTDGWVVLDTQVDVFFDTETEVTSSREVSVSQLVLLDLQTSFQDLFGLWTSDSDVHSNLFVSSDTESSDSVSSFGVDWSLTRQLFQDLGSSGQSVTGLTDRDV